MLHQDHSVRVRRPYSFNQRELNLEDHPAQQRWLSTMAGGTGNSEDRRMQRENPWKREFEILDGLVREKNMLS